MKEYMIEVIRRYQYYEAGALESLTENEVMSIYESLIDWIG